MPLLGDKTRFAVEYELHDDSRGAWPFGRLCYSCGGTQVGDHSRVTSLRDALFELERIVVDVGKRSNPRFNGLSAHVAFKLLKATLFGGGGTAADLELANEEQWARHLEKAAKVLLRLETKGWHPRIDGDGLRTPAQQAEKVRLGVSHTMNSAHVDVDGKGSAAMDVWDRNLSGVGSGRGSGYFWKKNVPIDSKEIGQQFWLDYGAIAKDEGLIWGGDWYAKDAHGNRKPTSKPFGWDPSHTELSPRGQ